MMISSPWTNPRERRGAGAAPERTPGPDPGEYR